MKSAMFMKKGLVEVQDVDKPTVKNPDDVVIKVLRACVVVPTSGLTGA